MLSYLKYLWKRLTAVNIIPHDWPDEDDDSGHEDEFPQ